MAWNQGDGNSTVQGGLGRARHPDGPHGKSSGYLKGIVAGIVVILGAAGVLLFLNSGEDESKASSTVEKKPAKIAEKAVVEQHLELPEEKKPDEPDRTAGYSQKWKDAKGLDPSLFPYKDDRKVIRTRTNEWQAVDICIMPNGLRRKVRRSVAKQLFSHVTDEVIMQALSSGDDEVGPPIPFSEDMEEDFQESLKTPIEIGDDDTPEQRRTKEQVAAAREAVADAIAHGSTFYDAITDHIAAQAANQNARETVMQSVDELRNGGEGDLVEDYLKDANKLLENMGASPILKSDIEEDEEEVNHE